MGTKRLNMLDSMFLVGETRESMMHVGGLALFEPPADAAPGMLRAVVEDFWRAPRVHPPWNYKLKSPGLLSHPLQAWVEDEQTDLDYHVRRSALPSPGDERELGILVSRLHSHPMDFHRPLWELHIIEGLSEGRFALYFKVHHSLVDGFTGTKLLMRSLARDGATRDTPPFFALAPEPRTPATGDTFAALLESVRDQVGATKDVGRALMNVIQAHGKSLVRPLQAPRSILNGRISHNRRFATQSFAMDRLRRMAKAVGGTLNDAVLALSSAALRRWLAELGALPDQPMIAMVPVNVRPKDDAGGGNAVGAILVSLATDVADPRARLEAIVASSRLAKEQLQGMSRAGIMQYSALLMAPMLLQAATGTAGRLRPAFNLVISNVPGPDVPLYFRGARIAAYYPVSIPFQGYGLNITTFSYTDRLCFGFIGCRRSVPHLQRLAVYAAEGLAEVEAALGLSG